MAVESYKIPLVDIEGWMGGSLSLFLLSAANRLYCIVMLNHFDVNLEKKRKNVLVGNNAGTYSRFPSEWLPSES